ncbi:MAG: histidine kinase [Minicystis sp.]
MDPKRRFLWILSLSFWNGLGFVCGLQIWISMISHGHALWRVVVYQMLIWDAWAILAPLIVRLARRRSLIPPTARSILVHVLAALLIAPVHSAWWSWLLVWIRPYDAMGSDSFGHAYVKTIYAGLPTQLLLYCGVLAAHYAADFYEKLSEKKLELEHVQASLIEARLHALELQIQPHFLFNTLNSISALARTSRSGEAVTMIAGLSDLLRYTLDHAGDQRVTVEEELRITRRYLEIERVRFPDRMSFEIDASPEALRAAVPTLILQPLVENAIRHGIARAVAAGRVEVRVRRAGVTLHIEVFNTGKIAADHRQGIGLRNTMARLRHLYRADHAFDLGPCEGGVLASVALPWSEVA